MSPKTARPSRPAVVKIGGSLVERGALADVLGIVARTRAPVVIVPGGGAFADLVRAEQVRLGIGDDAAHRMAMLAMAQTAHVLASLQPRLRVADSDGAMARALDSGAVPVWAPLAMADADPALPRDWTTTSDALAAWLAVRLGSPLIALVKSVTVDPCRTAGDLAAAGIVDPVFARIVAERDLAFAIVGPGEETRLAALLAALHPDAAAPARARTQAWPSVSCS
jgi:aspartokinase-like uncharacterized kinase